MEVSNLDLSMFLPILPEILLLVLAAVVLISDLIWLKDRQRWLGWMTVGGLGLIILLSLVVSTPGSGSQRIWGGMLRDDWLAFMFKMMFLGGAAITALFAMDIEDLQRGEFYVLLLTSTLGMTLMAASGDLIMLFLAIETTSIPLYVLAGFLPQGRQIHRVGSKVPAVRRPDERRDALWLQPAVRVYRDDGYLPAGPDVSGGSAERDRHHQQHLARPGRVWLQGVGCAVPFLGPGCL